MSSSVEVYNEYHRKYFKDYYGRNREKYRAQRKRWREKVKDEVLAAYGDKCACCGESTHEFLCIDHVNGRGNEHRRKLGSPGGHTFYSWLIKNNFPEGYRVLCYNCNNVISMYGYCPHQIGVN